MARSMVNQIAQIQKETTPGTAATNAMKKMTSIGLRPATATEGGQAFKAQGFKAPTTYQLGDLWGAWTVEGIQDFNGVGFPAASVFGPPTTTTPGGATNARQHVFEIDPDGPDTQVTWTAQFGDATAAKQATYLFFQSLGLTVQRGQLGFTSGAISKKPTNIAAVTTTGATTVPAAPIPTRSYNVYSDATWAGVGTTQVTKAYEFGATFGDKMVRDAPINSAVSGFDELVEGEDIDYSGNVRLAWNAVSETIEEDYFEAEAIRFLAIEVLGGLVEAGVNYELRLDLAVRFTGAEEVAGAPGSPVVTQNFPFVMVVDPTSNKFARLTIVNAVTSY